MNLIYDQSSELVRVYHSRMPLLDMGWQFQSGRRGVKYFQHDGITEPIAPMLAAVLNLPGVAAVEMHHWKFGLERSPAFTWEEIDQSLAGLFAVLIEPTTVIPIADYEETNAKEQNDLLLRSHQRADTSGDPELLHGAERPAPGVDGSGDPDEGQATVS